MSKPSWCFICERDMMFGPYNYRIGLVWKRRNNVEPGEFVYQKRFIINIKFRVWIERDY